MFRWVKSVVHRIGGGSAPPKETNGEAAVKPVVFLWAPTYDMLTQRTSEWLEQVGRTHGLVVYSHGLGRAQIEDALSLVQGSNSLAIFCGHGLDHALLGAPIRRVEILHVDEEPSLIYDTDMVNLGPRSMFAFCCKAGKELGRKFSALHGRAFLGYQNNIFVLLMNEECEASWKRIVEGFSAVLIRDGNISSEHEAQLRRLYSDEISRFRNGADKHNSENVEMQMTFLRHMKSLCLQKGNIG